MRGGAYGHKNNHKHGSMVRYNGCDYRTNHS